MHCYVKIQGYICSGPRIGGKMETKLNLISEMSKSDKELRFKTLMHLVNVMNLRKCFYMLKKDKAAGIDGIDFETYEKNLHSNLEELVGRMKQMSYRPRAVKRVYIPKSGGCRWPIIHPGLDRMKIDQIRMDFERLGLW
jgi:hypothetical protein